MSYEPVKCPDCGTWWRAAEHKCAPAAPKSKACKCGEHNSKESPYAPDPNKKYEGFKCVVCGEKAASYSMYCVKHRAEKWIKRKGEHGNGKDS
jgi:hypothetical protein